MIFNRLLQFTRRAFGSQTSPAAREPQRDAASPVKFAPDGDPIRIELDGMVITLGTVEMGSVPPDGLYDLPTKEPKQAERDRYRDEDGETRPLLSDPSSLNEMPLEEVAAEFLRAKSDAEAMPDPLERAFIAALRDAYSRELWRRATTYVVDQVTVGGSRYELVALPAID